MADSDFLTADLKIQTGSLCLTDAGEFLRGRERNEHSQFGEDGLIEAIFERIGTTNRWCFEIGAGDGDHLSNTRRLVDVGWSCIWLEEKPDLIQAALAYISRAGVDAAVVEGKVGAAMLDLVLVPLKAPADIDFGVIDIDGQDWWMWWYLRSHRPHVIMVEYAPKVPSDYIPPLNGYDHGQAGLGAILSLGKEKGYVPLARTYCNVLFVRGDVWTEKQTS